MHTMIGASIEEEGLRIVELIEVAQGRCVRKVGWECDGLGLKDEGSQ